MTNMIRGRCTGVGALVVAIAALVLVSGPAWADGCVSDCNVQKRDCIGSTAKPGKLSCKTECAATAERSEKGACMKGCVDEFRAAKVTCKSGRATCKGVCNAGDEGNGGGVDGACVSDCAHDLGDCARANSASAKECMTACKAEKGPGFPECVKGCAGSAAPGAQACNAAFRECAETCGATLPSTTVPPPSTTLPGSSTTLPGASTTVPGASTTVPAPSTTSPSGSTTTLP
jgi:hypothetical protein